MNGEIQESECKKHSLWHDCISQVGTQAMAWFLFKSKTSDTVSSKSVLYKSDAEAYPWLSEAVLYVWNATRKSSRIILKCKSYWTKDAKS